MNSYMLPVMNTCVVPYCAAPMFNELNDPLEEKLPTGVDIYGEEAEPFTITVIFPPMTAASAVIL